MTKITVGVLALQGAFAKHAEALSKLEVDTRFVRYKTDLDQCDALIIPGGESTTMMHHFETHQFHKSLQTFAEKKPIFGTCAGLILISREIVNDKMKPLNLVNVAVERNAFGRQVDSFRTDIELQLGNTRSRSFSALFIRAPRIRSHGVEVKVLAQYENEPILVQQGHHLGATFHPELTDDLAIHRYFLSLIS